MYDPKEPANDAEQKAQDELQRQRYEKIMATKDGRAAMWEILSSLGTFDPTFSDREAGAQQAGIATRTFLKLVNLELYHQMIVENDR